MTYEVLIAIKLRSLAGYVHLSIEYCTLFEKDSIRLFVSKYSDLARVAQRQ